MKPKTLPPLRLSWLGAALLLACSPPPPSPRDGGTSTPKKDAGPTPTVCLDNDGDGVPGTGECSSVLLVDCDDSDPTVYPDAAEECDGKDQNCDGVPDDGLTPLEYFADKDGDGYGSGTAESSCKPVAGKVAKGGDCSESDPAVNPGATEVCNKKDDDCNGKTDDGLANGAWYPDVDRDGFGAKNATAELSCTPVTGKVSNDTDCNDAVPSVNPNAKESCNNVDDNCNTQVDEGNPGGGTACNSGQPGVCGPGTVQCQGGALTCIRSVQPSAELCDGLDNDCDNQVDETWTNKGQSCTAGVGVCARSGSFVCKADKSGAECSVASGAPTANACDGQDNDCDGITDEPLLTSTADVSSTAWADVEVAPFYHSAASCAGGANGSGSDALAGGGMVLAGGTGGIYFQRLDGEGDPAGAPVAAASNLNYVDVALAQSGDGFLVAGVYVRNGTPIEVDFYYFDGATGAKRTQLWGQFNTGNALDSLRLVRGNGRRVTVVWRESGVGVRLAQVEAVPNGTSWTLQKPGGGSPSAVTLVAAAQAGLGADSNLSDWTASQTCAATTAQRQVAIAYLSTAQALRLFTVNEDGTGKGSDVVVDNKLGSTTIAQPEVAFFRSTSDQWFVGYVQVGTSSSDLQYWLTTAQSVHSAYASYASLNGQNSILRPRAAVDASRVWLTAVRYVSDPTAFKRQLMFRRIDFSGNKDPSSASAEIAPTSGACSGAPACRPGDKDGVAVWASAKRLYYSAGGSTPSGTYASALTCE